MIASSQVTDYKQYVALEADSENIYLLHHFYNVHQQYMSLIKMIYIILHTAESN